MLIGLALSRSPSHPRVAVVNETLPGETVTLGNRRIDVRQYAQEVLHEAQAIDVPTRERALEKLRAGEVLAAVVIPAGFAARLSSNTARANVEVLYNGNALEQSLVQNTINSDLAQANFRFAAQIQQVAAEVINDLLRGGKFSAVSPERFIGLKEIPGALARVIARLPRGRERSELEKIARFATFAGGNLSVSRQVLSTIAQPIAVSSTVVRGRRTPLNRYAVVVAVSVSLMLLAVLLAAGSIALEREEGALARLLRGLVSREKLLAEKALLGAVCSFAVALALLAGIGVFVALDWGRAGPILLALAFGAVACSALGVAIGVLAREVRAASLLAFLVALPLAFLALVPSGAVSQGLGAVIDAISYVFPFKAALQALDAAVNGAAPPLGGSLVHLALLTLAFGLLARVALTRPE